MQRAEFRCESCQAADKTLHAHHRIYIKGRAPWEYEDDDLACLCEECHRLWHEKRAELDDAIKYLTPGEFGLIAAYAQQLLRENHPFFRQVKDPGWVEKIGIDGVYVERTPGR